MKIVIANSLLRSVGVGWPKPMDSLLWCIEALVLRYCTEIEEFFDREPDSALQINPLLAAGAIKAIVEGQGLKEVRVAYAQIKSKRRTVGYRFWINYKLPGNPRWKVMKTSIMEYQ